VTVNAALDMRRPTKSPPSSHASLMTSLAPSAVLEAGGGTGIERWSASSWLSTDLASAYSGGASTMIHINSSGIGVGALSAARASEILEDLFGALQDGISACSAA
jgi:hypothetical protein